MAWYLWFNSLIWGQNSSSLNLLIAIEILSTIWKAIFNLVVKSLSKALVELAFWALLPPSLSKYFSSCNFLWWIMRSFSSAYKKDGQIHVHFHTIKITNNSDRHLNQYMKLKILPWLHNKVSSPTIRASLKWNTDSVD